MIDTQIETSEGRTYDSYTAERAASFLLHADTMPPADITQDRETREANALHMINVLDSLCHRLRTDASNEIENLRSQSDFNQAASLTRMLEAIDSGENYTFRAMDDRLIWSESLIAALANNRPVQVEIAGGPATKPTVKYEADLRYDITPQYTATDLLIAALLSTISKDVQCVAFVSKEPMEGVVPTEIYPLSAASGLLTGERAPRPSFKILRPHADDRRADILVTLLEQAGHGTVVYETDNVVRFRPEQNHTGRRLPGNNCRVNDLQLRRKTGEPTPLLERAVSIAGTMQGQLCIAVGRETTQLEQSAVTMLLAPLTTQDTRHQIIYRQDLPPQLVAYEVATELKRKAEQYVSKLREDLLFREMSIEHPYIYIDENYGKEMDHHPEGIFPNDIEAMTWLMDRLPGLMSAHDESEEIHYLNVGRGPFSWLDILVANHVTQMDLLEPSIPSIKVTEQWQNGTLPTEYQVGEKFEEAIARRYGTAYRGSEARARERSRILPTSIGHIAQKKYDLIGDPFTTCSISRDRVSLWRNTRRLAMALAQRPDSLLVRINMRGSEGWHGFPAYPVQEDDIVQSSRDNHLEIVDMTTINTAKLRPNDQGFIVSIARLQPDYLRRLAAARQRSAPALGRFGTRA